MIKTTLWRASEYDKSSKNVVLFSLNSLGRADIGSTPAGGSSKKVSRQNQIKNSTFDFLIDGRKFTAVPSKDQTNTRTRRKQKSGQNKQGKPAKPAVAPQNGSRKPGQIGRPKGYPRADWNKLSNEQKKSAVSPLQFSSQPPRVDNPQRRKKQPLNQITDQVIKKAGYGEFDSDWEYYRYQETADPNNDF